MAAELGDPWAQGAAARASRLGALCGRSPRRHRRYSRRAPGQLSERRAALEAVAAAGLDHIGLGDPIENFERYTPYGAAADVADFLKPHVEAGCRRFNLAGVAERDDSLIAHAAEVKRLLNR